MADPRRKPDDEPPTQLEVEIEIDRKQLDSLLEGEAATSPGTVGPPTHTQGADYEPKTMEPPRVMGVPRLRAHTMLGVAPPSSGAAAPPTTQPQNSPIPKIIFEGDEGQDQTETKPGDVPKIHFEGDDEQTTMVGKMLAEASAEVAKRLKDKEGDLYSDETATTVGDGEKLVAAANEAALAKGASDREGDETTENRLVHALTEDTTARQQAVNIDGALARAAELRAEAERKKRQLKKRTMHGLGDGPLNLPARGKHGDDIPTFKNELPDTGERPSATRPSDRLVIARPHADDPPVDGEIETLSAGIPQPAPMRSINTEPETMPVQVPSTSRERAVTAPAEPSSLLGPQTPEQTPFAAPPPQGPGFASTLQVPPNASPYTQPMPYAPTVRSDDNANFDWALRQTMNSPRQLPAAPITGPLPNTPSGGVPQFHSTPLPIPQYSVQPHSGQAAFAQTALQTGSGPAVVEGEPDKDKKGPSGIFFFLFILIALAGIGFWQRAWLMATWARYRQPASPAAPSTESPPSATPSAVVSAAPTVPPPVAIDTAPHASSSAAPHGSSSAGPQASAHASASPPASASASASAKTAPKKPPPPPWKPPPPKPKPTGVAPKPKPIDDNRGF